MQNTYVNIYKKKQELLRNNIKLNFHSLESKSFSGICLNMKSVVFAISVFPVVGSNYAQIFRGAVPKDLSL